MPNRIDRDLEVELHDVFHVQQVTRDTPIEVAVGADLVPMESGQSSQTHRHNFSETVLFFLGGEATVFINDTPHAVSAGDRILIHKPAYPSVAPSAASGRSFLWVQTRPIFRKATGFRAPERRDR